MKQVFLIGILVMGISRLSAQTASFNFSLASQPVSGWNNVSGDPSVAVRTATDAATGIAVSSVATANWAPYNGACAFDGGGATGGTFFPSAVMANLWFQYSAYYGAYNSLTPQLVISGLSKDSVYTVKMTGSLTNANFNLNPIRYTIAGVTVYGYIDVNGNSNTANGAVFNNIAPDATGKIRVYVNTLSTTTVAGISGLQITPGRTTAPTPVVAITKPGNNDIIPEDGNVTISATATETGGTISYVEFYANGTLLGRDSAAPYSWLWVSPDAGNYTVMVRAVDGLGNTNTASVQVSVEPLSSFWSMTGNIHMNPDSNFVGNVDSVRLALRTKNLERMSISATGNVGIGTISPAAQLHTTGSVRLAGLVADSTKNRILVSDTSGNLYYRNVSSLSNRWQYANGVVYDSTDNIGIGTNNTQGYRLAVNGSAIFTKVRIKPYANWPDFVFKKGYELPGLPELEQYLATHQHLPGVISADEQLKEGTDVGATQRILLQKIEELTLYLIRQDKELKELKQTNKALSEQNEQLSQQAKEWRALRAEIEALKAAIGGKQ